MGVEQWGRMAALNGGIGRLCSAAGFHNEGWGRMTMIGVARARRARPRPRPRIDTWDEFYHNGYEHMIDIRGAGSCLPRTYA